MELLYVVRGPLKDLSGPAFFRKLNDVKERADKSEVSDDSFLCLLAELLEAEIGEVELDSGSLTVRSDTLFLALELMDHNVAWLNIRRVRKSSFDTFWTILQSLERAGLAIFEEEEEKQLTMDERGKAAILARTLGNSSQPNSFLSALRKIKSKMFGR